MDNQDVFIEILSHLSYPDIGKLCQTNDQIHIVCQQKRLWSLLAERDFPTLIENKTQQNYILWYQFFDYLVKQYTDDRGEVYRLIRRLLVDYIIQYKTDPDDEDRLYDIEKDINKTLKHIPITYRKIYKHGKMPVEFVGYMVNQNYDIFAFKNNFYHHVYKPKDRII